MGNDEDSQLSTSADRQAEAPSKLQVVKTYFHDRGLTVGDLPVAFVYHELLGLAMAAGFWSACYITQPSRSIIRLASGTAAQPTTGGRVTVYRGFGHKMMDVAERKVASWKWLQKTPMGKRNPRRLTVSLAESLALRAAIKPITFPFKLWASWKMTTGTKRMLSNLPFRSRNEAAST